MADTLEMFQPTSGRIMDLVKAMGGWISLNDLHHEFSGHTVVVDSKTGVSTIFRKAPEFICYPYFPDAPILHPLYPHMTIAFGLVRDGYLRRSKRGGKRGFLLAKTLEDKRRKKF